MANQESTAIHDLIQLVQGGKVLEPENPVPELFIPAARPAVRLQETLDVAIANVPSLGHRTASGTPAPHVLPTPIAQGTPAQAYRIPTHMVEHDDEQTELWQGTPATQIAAPIAAPILAPIPTIAPRTMTAPATPRYETSHLPRELSPVVRYAGLGFLAIAAITLGTYLGASGGASDEPNERDRTIAIMNGELPAPVETTHVTAPTTPTVRIEAVVPAVAPIEPIEPAKPAEPVIWAAAPVVIDSTEIEMEAEARKPAARRAARSAKQSKPAIVEARVEKKKIEKAPKSKKDKNLVATEIAAPKGAAAAQGNGQVTISSNRPAMIYLDGRPTGKTAPSAFVIPAGDHQITLLDPGTKKAKTATVKVAANKSVSISRDFN